MYKPDSLRELNLMDYSNENISDHIRELKTCIEKCKNVENSIEKIETQQKDDGHRNEWERDEVGRGRWEGGEGEGEREGGEHVHQDAQEDHINTNTKNTNSCTLYSTVPTPNFNNVVGTIVPHTYTKYEHNERTISTHTYRTWITFILFLALYPVYR